jgi:hypothetical protein
LHFLGSSDQFFLKIAQVLVGNGQFPDLVWQFSWKSCGFGEGWP